MKQAMLQAVIWSAFVLAIGAFANEQTRQPKSVLEFLCCRKKSRM